MDQENPWSDWAVGKMCIANGPKAAGAFFHFLQLRYFSRAESQVDVSTGRQVGGKLQLPVQTTPSER